MSRQIQVVTIRAAHLHGRRIEVGTELQLSVADAHALVANGKAQLCDPACWQAVQAGLQKADLAAVQASPGFIPPVLPPY